MRLLLAAAILAFLPAAASGELPTTGFRAVDYEPELRTASKSTGKWIDLRCTILKYQGDWAWIHTWDGKDGWVKRHEVIPSDAAVSYFSTMITTQPRNTLWYQQRALAWETRGDLELALADLTEAIRVEPAGYYLYNSRGAIHKERKQYDRAIADYNTALKLAVRDPAAQAIYWGNASSTRFAMKDYDKALLNANRAIAIDPAQARYYRLRADALAWQGECQRAVADYNLAIAMDPNGPSSYADPAWMRATCPVEHCRDGEKAVELAKRACELSHWKESGPLNVLAAAYAESGDFENAVKYARQALEHATAVNKPDFSKRLALYEAGKPYHDE